MSSQPSQTRIVNRALTLIGTGKRILALDTSTPESRTMLGLFDDSRDAVLADHPWNFAIRRAALPADVDPPAFEYSFSYILPTDCLRWLPSRRGADDWCRIEQEGNLLLTNETAPLRIRYIGRIEDVALWSEGFKEALAYRLAAEAAEPLTADKGIGDRLMQRYTAKIAGAKRQNGLSKGDTRSGDEPSQSTWLAAREAGWGCGWDRY